MARTLVTVVVCFSLLAVAPAWPGPTRAWAQAVVPGLSVLYGADGGLGNPSHLHILDPSTGGVVATVGPIGYAVTGLAVHPTTGVLYGSVGNADAVAPGRLIRIDKTTGHGTIVGSFGIPSHTMADLTFTRDGTLYGWAEPLRDDLHTIDLTTGVATSVGDSGLSTLGSGLAASAGDTLFFAGSKASGALRTIDRTTGLPTTVGIMHGDPDDHVAALAFDRVGVLFGVALGDGTPRPAKLVTIDPLTAAITVVGPTVGNLDAIAFEIVTPVPALSDVAVVGLALLLIAIGLHRLRRGVRRA